MPELPEVETVVRGLAPVLVDHRLASVIANRPDLRCPIPHDLGQRLTGAIVTAVTRRAKYGLIATNRDDTLIFHLGMSGRMRLDPADSGPHDHVIFTTQEGHRIVFTDPRRFGLLALACTADLPRHPLLAGIGPEPLGPDFTAAYLARRVAGRIAPVKALLLDQRIVAGIGNIYASEALHRARLHPQREGGSLSRSEVAALVRSLRATLKEAIAAGGSSLRDHIGVDGVLGLFQKAWRVYGRAGAPCGTCGGEIVRAVQSGRSSFFCPTCQPLTDAHGGG